MKIVQFVLVILLLSSSLVYANTASETATEYFSTLKQKDYRRAATFFDPAALGEFRQMMGFVQEIPDEGQQQFYTIFFGPEANKESIAKLTDADFFASFLRATIAQAETLGGVNFGKMEVLGEVKEGKDVAHVVTRNKITVGEVDVEALEVISFKRIGNEWKALLSGKIKGLASQLKSTLLRN
ncbi:MAG: hypothetical protein EG822_10345 [Deltaproteobacteria bacterium]|nr:hypothetical protein [Deltaproteobacteria bacterium]TLN04091.1 MAG: hypothetical protein FDZ73_05135 [bacterium]